MGPARGAPELDRRPCHVSDSIGRRRPRQPSSTSRSSTDHRASRVRGRSGPSEPAVGRCTRSATSGARWAIPPTLDLWKCADAEAGTLVDASRRSAASNRSPRVEVTHTVQAVEQRRLPAPFGHEPTLARSMRPRHRRARRCRRNAWRSGASTSACQPTASVLAPTDDDLDHAPLLPFHNTSDERIGDAPSRTGSEEVAPLRGVVSTGRGY